MILECGGCAKMYRVRDDASPHPTLCPTCGGTLKATGGGNAPTATPARVKELETRIQSLERELAETRTLKPSLSVETSPGISGLSAPVAELRAAAEKADRLERELFSFRSEMERKLKEKDREAADAREAADREAAERRKQDAKIAGLEETHARALEGKEKTTQALDASIASYRSKVESIQKKLDAVEIQRLNDLNAFDTRVREREQSDRAQLDRSTQAQQKAVTDLRAEMEAKIAEKDRLISEGRQGLDREAGERRRLSETLSRLQENADRSVAEKDASISALEATLSSYKSKTETLQSRVESLEQMRRSEHDQLAKRVRASQAIRGRVDEASHLAIDLDHSLDSIEASIATLRDRARRLRTTLQETEAESNAMAPLSSATSSFAPAPEAELEPLRPALSQSDPWAPTPSPVEEEPPAFSTVTKTMVKQAPQEEPEIEEAPVEEAPAPAEEPMMELAPAEPEGRLEEPSGVVPVAEASDETPAASPAMEDTADDLPLISPPEDEAAAEPKPAAAPPPPPGQKPEDPKRKRFSWQRK